MNRQSKQLVKSPKAKKETNGTDLDDLLPSLGENILVQNDVESVQKLTESVANTTAKMSTTQCSFATKKTLQSSAQQSQTAAAAQQSSSFYSLHSSRKLKAPARSVNAGIHQPSSQTGNLYGLGGAEQKAVSPQFTKASPPSHASVAQKIKKQIIMAQ